jgi:hypothetical protein
MAITFKYGAPGPILQAGFAAGVGRRQQRQQDDALEIWQQQNQQQFQAGQAAINRRFQYGMQEQQFGNQLELQNLRFQDQALQDQETRAFQAEQAGLGRDFQAGQTTRLIEARNADSAMDRDQRSQLLQQQQNFAREQATQEGLRSGALELPPEAQNRLRQLESGRVEAMKLDPVQQQEFMDQYEREKSTLLGLAQPATSTFFVKRRKTHPEPTWRNTQSSSRQKPFGSRKMLKTQVETSVPTSSRRRRIWPESVSQNRPRPRRNSRNQSRAC